MWWGGCYAINPPPLPGFSKTYTRRGHFLGFFFLQNPPLGQIFPKTPSRRGLFFFKNLKITLNLKTLYSKTPSDQAFCFFKNLSPKTPSRGDLFFLKKSTFEEKMSSLEIFFGPVFLKKKKGLLLRVFLDSDF